MKNFISSFSVYVYLPPLHHLPSLIALTFSIMFNRCGKSGRTCIFLSISGKAFSFSPSIMTLAIGFCTLPFIRVRKLPPISSLLRVFIILWEHPNGYWILSNTFSTSTDNVCFPLLNVTYRMNFKYWTSLAFPLGLGTSLSLLDLLRLCWGFLHIGSWQRLVCTILSSSHFISQ